MTMDVEQNYNQLASRTESNNYAGKIFDNQSFKDFMQFAIYSSQFLDLFKKRFYYNRQIDEQQFEKVLKALKENVSHIEQNKDGFLSFDPEDYSEIREFSVEDNNLVRLLHAGVGVMTEGGELIEALAKKEFDNEELDLVNISEENGDIDWYQAIVYNVTGKKEGDIRRINIEKLMKRYPDGFSDVKANNRDLEAEREILNKVES